MPPHEIEAETLVRLVSDPALRQASQAVAAEIAAMPAPADLAHPLLAVAR